MRREKKENKAPTPEPEMEIKENPESTELPVITPEKQENRTMTTSQEPIESKA